MRQFVATYADSRHLRQRLRALHYSPGMADLWVKLGVIYRATGQHRAAENAYLQALALDPGEHSAWLGEDQLVADGSIRM